MLWGRFLVVGGHLAPSNGVSHQDALELFDSLAPPDYIGGGDFNVLGGHGGVHIKYHWEGLGIVAMRPPTINDALLRVSPIFLQLWMNLTSWQLSTTTTMLSGSSVRYKILSRFDFFNFHCDDKGFKVLVLPSHFC